MGSHAGGGGRLARWFWVEFLIDFRLRGERVCLPQAWFRKLVFGRFLSDFALAACLLKAFGVAEVLSLLAKKVPKETSPGIARNPAKKFACQGAVVTRTALPSRCSNIRRLKTLANDFLTARFTGPKEQLRRAKP